MDEGADNAGSAERELLITRTLRAPAALVYQAWTRPEHVTQWWGSDGFTTTTGSMEVTPGGLWRYTMHGPDGTDYSNVIVYREVVENERLVYHHGSSVDDPDAFVVTVRFHTIGEWTRLSMQMLFASVEGRDRAVEAYAATEGAEQSLDRLENYLDESTG